MGAGRRGLAALVVALGVAAALSWSAPAGAAATPVEPFATVDLFVKQQYRDFLGRDPFAVELSTARATLADGSDTVAESIDRIAHQPDGATRTCNVGRLYTAYFLRLPDASGLDYWLGKSRAGRTLSTISQSFATSSEFVRRYGALSDPQFVDRAFENVFGRPADAGGRSYWIGKLAKGTSRGQVMANFSTSSEYVRKQATTCEVVVAYHGLLRRIPTASELTAASAVVGAEGFVGLAEDLVAVPAWRARFPGPGAPTNVKAVPADGRARVSWTPPTAKGTGITGYTVRPYLGSTPLADRTAAASATTLTITGLANGSTYTFAVFARTTNVVGPAGTSPATLVAPDVMWSTVGGNPAHTNVQPHGTVPATPTERWERSFGTRRPLQVVVGAGKVFVLVNGDGSPDDPGPTAYALDPTDGHILWGPVTTSGTFYTGFIGYEEGRVFLENDEGLLRTLDAGTGALLWSRDLGDHVWDQQGITVYDGTVYAFADDLMAIDAATGTVRWRQHVGNDSGTPGVDASGIYVTQVCDDYKLRFDGTEIWHLARPCTGGGAGTATLSGGKAWFDGDWGADASSIRRQSDGAEIGTYTGAQPAVLGNRAYYDEAGTLTAVDHTTGVTAWSQAGDGHLQGSPVVNAGRVYLASERGLVYSYDAATGTPVWSRTVISDLATPVAWYDANMGALSIGDGILLVSVANSVIAYG